MRAKIVIGLWLALGAMLAQQEGARELFYIAAAKKEALPPIRKAKGPPSAASPAAVTHLGLRYNLALVDSANKLQPVDADQIFRSGQCVALQMEVNRSGYVYVFARQSSGRWQPLLPNPEMPNESNIVDPGQNFRVPNQHCFEITDPPGSETLFVVFSRDPADLYELNEAVKGRAASAPNSTQVPERLDTEVERFARAAQQNDVVRSKIAQPAASGEQPNSVYVVSRANQPASQVTTEILIRHQ